MDRLRLVLGHYLRLRMALGERTLLLNPEWRKAAVKLSRRPVEVEGQLGDQVAGEELPRTAVSTGGRLLEPMRGQALSRRLSRSEKLGELEALQERARACVKCPHLAAFRQTVVFGEGDPEAAIMFVGEAPGADEDRSGRPFVGAAGQLLTKMIGAMGLKREEVYIANVLKCRPDMPSHAASGNRKPTQQEMATCLPYVASQIEIIRPVVIVALGTTAVEGLLNRTKVAIGQARGVWHEFRGIPVRATYHPAYLLRNQAMSEKRKVWEDLLAVMERAGLPISEKQRSYFSK